MFTRLSSGVVLEGDISHRVINKILKSLPNIFGMADNILIVECYTDGRDHDRTLRQMMQICH